MVLVVKNPLANAGDTRDAGSIPGSARSLEEEIATHSVLLARESHGQRSLMGCSPWGGKELDATAHRCACAQTCGGTHTHTHTHTRRRNEVIEQGLKSRSLELKGKTLCSSPQTQPHLISSTSLYLPGGLRPCTPCFSF